MTDLDIYVERLRTFDAARDYTLKLLLPKLERAGIGYRILDRFDPQPVGRRALLHVDLTELPEPFAQIHRFYEKTINGRACTIRRTLYSTARLERGADYSGPVIVKTILNSGGYPELRYRKNRSLPSRLAHGVSKMIEPGYKRRLCPPYEVFPSLAEVSDGIWRDQRLMVERFLPGTLQPPVTKYRYCFLRDTSLTLKSTYGDLLCSSGKVLSNELIETPPEPVTAVRSRLALDFGAIDYFMVDGKAEIIDVNKTVATAAAWMVKFDYVKDYVDRAAETLIAFARS